MLYAIALQAGRMISGGTVASRQVILVPAAGIAFGRRITTLNPRKPWRPIDYDLGHGVWGWDTVSNALRATTWPSGGEPFIRNDFTWRFVMDAPVLFHVKDDEYVEMKRGGMPRNVALRYQRAVEAHNAVLIGADATTVEDATSALHAAHRAGTSTLQKAPGDNAMDRLAKVLEKVDEGIRNGRTTMLDNYVPREARAKGAGPHRAHDNLPALVDEAAPVVATPYVAPAPAIVLKGADVVKHGDVLTRPNGMPYVAREVKDLDVKGGISDVQLFRHAHKAGVHTLLWGPPGTGKTAGLEVAFPGMVNMIGTPETEADDFLGQYVAVLGKDGREVLVWEDGPLVKAAEAGVPLFVDEIGLIPSNQVAPLLGVMDGRKEIRITANPARGTIRVKDGFTVVAAFNPSTARHVSEALISRFGLKIAHSSDFTAARSLGCNPRLVDAAEHMNAQMENGELGWAPQMRELLQARDDEALLGLVYALRNLAMNAPDMERDLVIGHLRERFGDIPGAARKIKPLSI